jgi:phenylacetate-CoA ligase
MFRDVQVADFKAELVAPNDLEVLLISIEARPGADADAVAAGVRQSVRDTFGLTPDIAMLETGTLAKEFESSVKTPRFIDRRR